ncbi:MAG: hypothetical protein K9M94_14945 [Spirochaetia bacterium]|nr:hypothetical protein [Spirochaetia bacterium]
MDITEITVDENDIREEEILVEDDSQPEESKELVLQRLIDPVIKKMESLTVTDDSQFKTAGEWLVKSKETKNLIEEKLGPELEAAKEKKRQAEKERKEVDNKIKQFTDPLNRAENAVRKMIAAYQTEQEKKRRAEEEKRRKEAEKKRQEELKKREESGDTTPVEEDPIPEAPVAEKKEEPKVEGVSFYEHWDFEIENEKAIPRQFLSVDESKIRKYVKAMKIDAEIPGVRVYMEKKPRVR